MTKCIVDKIGINISNIDKGIVKSSWKMKSENHHHDLKSRLVLPFQDKSWKKLQIKCETYYFIPKGKGLYKSTYAWKRGGYDPELVEAVYREIASKIGEIISLQKTC